MSVEHKRFKLNIEFQRYNSKHNRLWNQSITLCLSGLAVISAFTISMFVLSINKENWPIIFKEYLVLSIILIILGIMLTATSMSLWTTRNKLIRFLKENKVPF